MARRRIINWLTRKLWWIKLLRIPEREAEAGSDSDRVIFYPAPGLIVHHFGTNIMRASELENTIDHNGPTPRAPTLKREGKKTKSQYHSHRSLPLPVSFYYLLPTWRLTQFRARRRKKSIEKNRENKKEEVEEGEKKRRVVGYIPPCIGEGGEAAEAPNVRAHFIISLVHKFRCESKISRARSRNGPKQVPETLL